MQDQSVHPNEKSYEQVQEKDVEMIATNPMAIFRIEEVDEEVDEEGN
jgi:hypothetical protein